MDYLDYVKIDQGTKSTSRFSNGNTLPLTQLPFGMVSFAPQTDGSRDSWFYHPDDRCIEGIRLTHQPSPWIGDYGALLMTPQSGTPCRTFRTIWSGYDPKKTVLSPSHIQVHFIRSNATFALTPTERGASCKITYFDHRMAFLSILPIEGNMEFTLDMDNNRLLGHTDHVRKTAKNFTMYFILQFDSGDIDAINTVISEGKEAYAHIAFKNEAITFKMATSYISYEQALLNLERESMGHSFMDTFNEAQGKWENCLSRIEVRTKIKEEMYTFYSCLYRVFLYPHKCYEYDINNEPMHYCPHDGAIRKGVRYTDTGFWDAYRTEFPLLSIIARKEYAEMLEGFVNDYRDGSWLPRWIAMDEVGCMPSTLIDAVICDAAVKNLVSKEVLSDALLGMLKHANETAPEKRYGRTGVSDYIRSGYVPYDNENESVNLTLDAAYGDFCIATVARILGREDLVKTYTERSYNYKNLFDKETGFMRAKDREGNFRKDFNKYRWGLDYTEGSAWQNSFAVPHDIDGLAKLYGGKEELIGKLTELFNCPPLYYTEGYGREIHEMTEMAAADFGQCAISNQPSFHLPYMFAYLGNQHMTDYWVQRICKEAFTSHTDGFPGDEDNGTMSAWYIFSMLGFYPLCPGKPEYVKGRMQVIYARINGRKWNSRKYGTMISHSVFE
jgi:predicted alpha-1,2-mannosidase